MRKPDVILVILVLAFILVVGSLVYFNTGDRVNITGNAVSEFSEDSAETTQETIGPVKTHPIKPFR